MNDAGANPDDTQLLQSRLKDQTCWRSERRPAVLLMQAGTHKDVSLLFHVYLQRK